jgi:type IVB pilus formation R64 PilN family outer membrane protein
MRIFLLAAAAALTLTGCITAQETVRTAEANTAAGRQSVDAFINREPARPSTGAVISDVPYVNVNPVQVEQRFPESFYRQVNLREPVGIQLQVLFQRVEALAGVKVTFQNELRDRGGSGQQAQPSALANLPPLDGDFTAAVASFSTGYTFDYSGDVKGLLDHVAAATRSHWRYDAHMRSVDFFRYQTESFRVEAIPGRSASQMSVGAVAGDTMSSASAQVTHSADGSVWGDVEAGIQRLLSPEGVYSMATSLGTVVVRDVPDRIALVREFMRRTNESLARQVDFEVTIYRVSARSEDLRGLNWAGLFQEVIQTSPYAIAFDTIGLSPGASNDAVGQAVIRVREDVAGDPQRYGGSQLVLDALSTLGNTTVVQTSLEQTTNNVPALMRSMRRVAYISEVGQAIAGGAGQGTPTGQTATQETVETGLQMFLLPHVQDDGRRIALSVMGSISTLDRLDREPVGDTVIQLPQTSSTDFRKQAWMNSGEVMLLAAFDQESSSIDRASPFDARLWGLTGRRQARNERDILVVAITPIVRSARSGI